MATDAKIETGAGFLTSPVTGADFLTLEKLSDEQRDIRDAAATFIQREVMPKSEEIDAQEAGLMPALLKEAGEQGLLMIDVPEEYGGADLGMTVSALVAHEMRQASFAVAQGAHTTIGTLPIVFYGTDAQKRQYLPRLATGELIGAYALTEPGVGSDAMSIRTRAVLSPDGTKYILNGAKQWISNAGFADVMIVFAKVDDTKHTAFIVESAWSGISTGAEEKKVGIKGSSTRTVYFDNVEVPVENVLGEIGKGYKIAFNILNIGRLKLGAGASGGARSALDLSAAYANERKAFGRPLSGFGMIKKKLAYMAADVYAAEAVAFRTVGMVEDARLAAGEDRMAQLGAIEEFTIECSIAKVFASEALALAAEEGLQMLGGYGFCEDYPLEQIYRDERVNRIFEGTNEINRMLVPGMLLRKAMKKQLPLFAAAKQLAEDLLGPPSFEEAHEPGFLEDEGKLVAAMKKASVAALGFAAQKFGEDLKDHQEILSDTADMIMEAYACESGLLRALKQAERHGEDGARLMVDMVTLFVHDAMDRVEVWGRNVLAQSAEGDELRTMMSGVRRLTKHLPVNRERLHDAIAAKIVEAGAYTTV